MSQFQINQHNLHQQQQYHHRHNHNNNHDDTLQQFRDVDNEQETEEKLQEEQAPSGEWSGLESEAMQEARCSLLLPSERLYHPKIKTLPPQRVMVYQDKAVQPKVGLEGGASFIQDFTGAVVLQLEPISQVQYKTMPVTLTVAGRCNFTARDYRDFAMMMRSNEQADAIQVPPNGTFDWPDVEAFMLCPVCGAFQDIPPPASGTTAKQEQQPYHTNDTMSSSASASGTSSSQSNDTDATIAEYWMVFHPIFQIQIGKANRIVIASRTICRLVCLDCMDSLLDGVFLTSISQQQKQQQGPQTDSDGFPIEKAVEPEEPLSAMDILEEVGSVSFLQENPPRPENSPNMDDDLDAWTLFQLWEHCGAWEALQNDYKMCISISMKASHLVNDGATETSPTVENIKKPDPPAMTIMTSSATQAAKERYGRKCASPLCQRVHGKKDAALQEVIRLSVVCDKCQAVYYCSKACRRAAAEHHSTVCMVGVSNNNGDKEIRAAAKKIPCDVCEKVLPLTLMKKCSKCRVSNYCSIACQRRDWKTHKGICEGLK